MNKCCSTLNQNTRIINSRYKSGGKNRRYECLVCGNRFSTFETIVHDSVSCCIPLSTQAEAKARAEIAAKFRADMLELCERIK